MGRRLDSTGRIQSLNRSFAGINRNGAQQSLVRPEDGALPSHQLLLCPPARSPWQRSRSFGSLPSQQLTLRSKLVRPQPRGLRHFDVPAVRPFHSAAADVEELAVGRATVPHRTSAAAHLRLRVHIYHLGYSR